MISCLPSSLEFLLQSGADASGQTLLLYLLVLALGVYVQTVTGFAAYLALTGDPMVISRSPTPDPR